MSIEIGGDERNAAIGALSILYYFIWNAVTFVICLACNGMQGKFSKYKIGEVSDMYPSALSPAGFAFSIWGLIYLGLLAFLCYHFVAVLDSFRQNGWHHKTQTKQRPSSLHPSVARVLVDDIGIWFGVSNLLNALWVPVFVQGTRLSISIAAVVLIGLVSVLIKIQIGVHHWWRVVDVRAQVPSKQYHKHENDSSLAAIKSVPPTPVLGHNTELTDEESNANKNSGARIVESSTRIPGWELILVDFPFSIYLGWATAAAIVSTTLWVEHVLLKNSQESLWSFMLVLVVFGIGFLIFGVFYVWKKQNFAAGLVFTWAAGAICVKAMSSNGRCVEAPNFDKQNCNVVGITALGSGCLIAIFSIFQLVRFVLKVVAENR